ncbi:hypothetical protein K469DRAFT_651266 [Zopfia rhizophila CBS 207.26]|uniref:GPI inositol-deacylase winged helix domain-containing protein n=1 Tax=Zopfia rhizophila CBS 207.26 TaxID=1314779 RepID=A0A6A6EVH7_9PEZI|nr:hypothetical protein K469DRAFT_651266 [Zopfia rhizophila CBS 207.26]
MDRVQKQYTKPVALRILGWRVYAVRALLLRQVQHAVAVDELKLSDRSISAKSLMRQSVIVNACAGMIRIDGESNIISLVHKTTQEYFDQSGPKHFPQAQWDIAITCLKYLSLKVFSEGHCSTDELYERRLRKTHYLSMPLGVWAIISLKGPNTVCMIWH